MCILKPLNACMKYVPIINASDQCSNISVTCVCACVSVYVWGDILKYYFESTCKSKGHFLDYVYCE